MNRKHMTRVVARVPKPRYTRSPEVHERFIGWATLKGVDPVATLRDDALVIERDGRRWLSVREMIRDTDGRAMVTARTGDRVRFQRRNFPIDSLPDWL